MSSKLSKLENPSLVEQWRQSRDGRELIAEVRLANMKRTGVKAFTLSSMADVIDVDRARRNLSDDPHEQLLLAHFQQVFIQKAQEIQQSLFNPWMP